MFVIDYVSGLSLLEKILYLALPIFIFLLLSVVKVVFGTYSIISAVSIFKVNTKIRERYLELFVTRESLQYHISWSKSRGDFDEYRNLLAELDKLDKVRLLSQ